MANVLIFLLAFLLVFVKYGEQSSKFMSIHGDINLAFFPTIEIGETVGFVYENDYGGFALLVHYCESRQMGRKTFIKQTDCTVQSNKSSSANPDHNNYIAQHEPNFPDVNTGTNLIVGKYDTHYERTVVRDAPILYIANVTSVHDRSSAQILCNDKNSTHYRTLFQFDNTQLGYINFRKGDRNEYEQTMKCIAIVIDNTDHVVAASVFSMTIGDLEPITTMYQSSIFLDTRAIYHSNIVSSQYAVEFINETSDASPDDTQVETSFIFRTDDTNGCTPDLIMEKVQTKQRTLKFTYDNKTRTMPSIYADESHICGVTRELQSVSLFIYSCKCK